MISNRIIFRILKLEAAELKTRNMITSLLNGKMHDAVLFAVPSHFSDMTRKMANIIWYLSGPGSLMITNRDYANFCLPFSLLQKKLWN